MAKHVKLQDNGCPCSDCALLYDPEPVAVRDSYGVIIRYVRSVKSGPLMAKLGQ